MFHVMIIKEGILSESCLLTSDREKAQRRFLKECRIHRPDLFEGCDRTENAVELLDNGYVELRDGGSVMYIDLTNTEGYDTATRIIIEVNGGAVSTVWGDESCALKVLDWDNLKSGDEFDFTPEEPNWDGPDGNYGDFLTSDSFTEAKERNEENKHESKAD